MKPVTTKYRQQNRDKGERKRHSESTRCAQKRRILKDTVKDMRYLCRCPYNLLRVLFPGKKPSNSMKHFLKLTRRRLESKPVAFKFSSLKSIVHANIFRTQEIQGMSENQAPITAEHILFFIVMELFCAQAETDIHVTN